MADKTRHAFVCGHPVGHSRSPLIHGHWLAQHGIDGTYAAYDVAADDFPGFVGRIRRGEFAGGNVTIPHKEAAFAVVDQVDKAARRIGAVNTIWRDGNTLHGTNTDWSGFAASLDQSASDWAQARRTVVLGAGGASRGVVYALIERGISSLTIVNRTRSRAEALAADFADIGSTDISVTDWRSIDTALARADLLINTTSLGMDGGDVDVPDLSGLASSAIVTDIVYVPLETPLLKAAGARGLTTVDGLGMLLHQAVPGFEKWFGVRPEVTADLRRLVLADMGHEP